MKKDINDVIRAADNHEEISSASAPIKTQLSRRKFVEMTAASALAFNCSKGTCWGKKFYHQIDKITLAYRFTEPEYKELFLCFGSNDQFRLRLCAMQIKRQGATIGKRLPA